ncbi:MAG TPA: polysaccharide pyruvyl transferase family protein [Saprospiraceae bacterium]|nr:polysaccharide pyruvyl transferase family protein [Saprospiraceae bacterium]
MQFSDHFRILVNKWKGETIPLRSAIGVKNIGDRLSATIVEHVSGKRVFNLFNNNKPHMIAVGSLLHTANKFSTLWGCGLMSAEFSVREVEGSQVHALRGKHSADFLMKEGIRCRNDIAFGDPGYLIRELPEIKKLVKNVKKKYTLGLIPHYVDYTHPFIQDCSTNEEVLILDVRKDYLTFMEDLLSCHAIASSSLHGLIFAEALDIPNVWIQLTDKVVGKGFKFRDWFSLSGIPQDKPIEINEQTRCTDLIRNAEMHEMHIDIDHLIQSFPRTRFDWKDHRKYYPILSVEKCRKKPIPIFIISFNRPEWLSKVIASYRLQTHPIEIVVHDNGSDDPVTIRLLKKMERQKDITVYRYPKIKEANDLHNINLSLQEYFKYYSEPQRYIITDCDVDFSETSPDAIEVLDILLDRFHEVACAGPMLRIRDIPRSYPLYNRLINWEVKMFWNRKPKLINIDHQRKAAILPGKFDTTFALYRAGSRFSRIQEGLRVYEPYDAIHLDWYITKDGSDFFQNHYVKTSNSNISHWGNLNRVLDSPDETLIPENIYTADFIKQTGEINIRKVSLIKFLENT